jgi:hypothetical protein
VPDGHHSGLQVILEHLVERCGPSGPAFAAPPLASAPSSVLPEKWVHETSNDERFTGRDDEIARLDRWVRDAAVRVLGVSAVGGTGKTALIGHWLKETAGWRSRPFAGLFTWSFYQNRDTGEFLKRFLGWARETFRIPEAKADTKLVATALATLRRHPLVLVLDGLEVLQEGPGDTSYGSFLDDDLRELLAAFCQRDHESLAVLTSRFVFADLDRFLGTAFHQLELHGLAPDNGARLLEELGVCGPPAEREHVSEEGRAPPRPRNGLARQDPPRLEAPQLRRQDGIVRQRVTEQAADEPQHRFVRYWGAEEGDDAEEAHLYHRQLLFIEDEQAAELVVEGGAFGQGTDTEAVVEKTPRLIAVFFG